ncbi:MAG: MarR family winged helix-turn-helix transcriptional regulator [Pseudomonadota bacterium]
MDDLYDPAQHCVALTMRRLSRVVTRRYEDALRPLKLKSFQFSTLVALSKREQMPQSKLAQAFGMDISTLNRNLKPLAARGAIEILPDETDGRVRMVKLTEEGRALYAAALPLWKAAQADALERLDPTAWPSLKRGVNRLLDGG